MRKRKPNQAPAPAPLAESDGDDSPDWIKKLPTFDMTNIKPLFEEPADAGRDADVGLQDDRRHVRRSDRRHMLHMLHVANAAKQLERLPDAGETFHCIMRGNYNGWDLVPAVLRLADPVAIKTLHVATLGFNERNCGELLELLDAKKIGSVAFICSVYFRSTTPEVWDRLYGGLRDRGHRAVAIRCHAKILGFELNNGCCLTVESSANLRSCHNIEQFTMTNDRGLLEFHRSWMDEVIAEVPL